MTSLWASIAIGVGLLVELATLSAHFLLGEPFTLWTIVWLAVGLVLIFVVAPRLR
jgi:hypothetical protein